ncbi:MAG TPA: hypothetical protein GXZ95_03505 [Mollicutes bacterium]|nr:hypothetical protein [Mollicutes bacterium]
MGKKCLKQLLDDLSRLKMQLEDNANKHLEREILYGIINITYSIEKFYKPLILRNGFYGYKYKKTKEDIVNNEKIEEAVSLLKGKSKCCSNEDKLDLFLSECINSTYPIKVFENSTTNFNKKDYYGVVGDFLKWYNDDAFLLFKNMWQNKQINLIDSNKWRASVGACYLPIRYLKKGYIFSLDTKSLFTMETIVHEMQHAFEEEISNYKKTHENFLNFNEVATNFIELLFLNYLKENKMFLNETHNQHKKNIIAFRSTALNLQNKLTIESAIKNYYEENKEKKEETLQTLSISKVIKILNDRGICRTGNDIMIARNIYGPGIEVYLNNYLIAHKIFELYLKDKKQALNIIETLSTNRDKDPIEKLNESCINISYDSLFFSYKNYIKNVLANEQNKDDGSKGCKRYTSTYY